MESSLVIGYQNWALYLFEFGSWNSNLQCYLTENVCQVLATKVTDNDAWPLHAGHLSMQKSLKAKTSNASPCTYFVVIHEILRNCLGLIKFHTTKYTRGLKTVPALTPSHNSFKDRGTSSRSKSGRFPVNRVLKHSIWILWWSKNRKIYRTLM